MGKNKIDRSKPLEPTNVYSYFVSSNPSTSFNPNSVYPSIDKTAFIGPFSSIIGDVRICSEVFIGCNATIRADEGTPFYIGNEVSIAHGALVHGPCVIGANTFVGFNAIVFNSIVEDGCYIDLAAIVTDGVRIPANRYVPTGAIIDTQEKANALAMVSQSNEDFAKGVIKTNIEL